MLIIENYPQQKKKSVSTPWNLDILPTIKAALRMYRRISEMLFKLQIQVLLHMVEFPHCLLIGHSEEQTCHHSKGELTT